MTEPELVGGPLRIDGNAINCLVANAEKTRAKADQALTKLLANGVEVCLPPLPATWKWIGGKVFSFRVRIADPA